MIILIVTFLSIINSIIMGCSKTQSPPCKLDQTHIEKASANAGCLVVHNEKLLIIKHRMTNKLGIPGGTRETNETAQCTAHRETWEETGYSVIVGKKLKVFDNGFHLYQCSLDGEFTQGDLTDYSNSEVLEVLWVDPNKIKQSDWRFPKQLTLIKTLYKQRL